MRKQCLEEGAKDDGEFWMSLEDMKKHFTNFEMCSVSIDQLHEDDSGMCVWLTVTAGVCGILTESRQLYFILISVLCRVTCMAFLELCAALINGSTNTHCLLQ